MDIAENLKEIAEFRKANRTAARVAYYNRHTDEHASSTWNLWLAISELSAQISHLKVPLDATTAAYIRAFKHHARLLAASQYRLPPDGLPQFRHSKASHQLREMKPHVSREEYLRMARLAVAVCAAPSSAEALISFIAFQDAILESAQ